MNSRLT